MIAYTQNKSNANQIHMGFRAQANNICLPGVHTFFLKATFP